MKRTALLLALILLFSMVMPCVDTVASDEETVSFDPETSQLLYVYSRNDETIAGTLYVYITGMEKKNQVINIRLALVNDTNQDFKLFSPYISFNHGTWVGVAGSVEVASGATASGLIIVNLDKKEFQGIDLDTVESMEISYPLSFDRWTLQAGATKSEIKNIACLRSDYVVSPVPSPSAAPLPSAADFDPSKYTVEDLLSIEKAIREFIPDEDASAVENAEYADQAAFLRDMAEGITLRLNDDRDSLPMTKEETAAYYLTKVGYELDIIEKYETQVFEDGVFNDLAHLYIDACQTQRFAAQNYKNSALYDALWEGGRKTRSAIIVELYSRYDLPITSEQAARYAPTPSHTVSVSSGSPGNIKDYTNDLQITSLPVWNEHYSNADYYHYDLIVENVSADRDLSVTVSAVFLDANGNVIGTDKATIQPIGKGAKQYVELKTDKPFSTAKYTVEQAVEDRSYTSGLSDISFSTSLSGKKVIVAATNNGQETISWGKAYCVFYNGENIVDVDFGILANSNSPLKPGETHYEEFEPLYGNRAVFDRYEMYYQFFYKKN